MYIFGGIDAEGEVTNEFWMMNMVDYLWEPIISQGQVPSPRYNHMAAVSGNYLIVWGGRDKTNNLNDMY